MKSFTLILLLTTGCSSQPDNSAILPQNAVASVSVRPNARGIVPTNAPAVNTNFTFIYPVDVTGYSRYVQYSTDLLNWVTIAGPFTGSMTNQFLLPETNALGFIRAMAVLN